MESETKFISVFWVNHPEHFKEVLSGFIGDTALVDVTLICKEKCILAHKLVLSANSPSLRDFFTNNPSDHPIILLMDMEIEDVEAVVHFMYLGHFNVKKERLPYFLKTAELLGLQFEVEEDRPEEVEMPKILNLEEGVENNFEQFQTNEEIESVFEKSGGLRQQPSDADGVQSHQNFVLPSKDNTIKSFSCSSCPRSFNTNRGLSLHMRIHYSSRILYKSSKDIPADDEHALIGICERKTSDICVEDNAKICAIYEKAFESNVEMKTHLLQHKEKFVCSFCSKGFEKRSERHAHAQTHVEVSLFMCTSCPRIFFHIDDLKIHEDTHSGINVEYLDEEEI